VKIRNKLIKVRKAIGFGILIFSTIALFIVFGGIIASITGYNKIGILTSIFLFLVFIHYKITHRKVNKNVG